MNYLLYPSFHGVNRFFVLSFEDNAHQRSYKRNALLTVEIKDCNVMTDGKSYFWPANKNVLITYKNSQKIGMGQGDDSQLVVC